MPTTTTRIVNRRRTFFYRIDVTYDGEDGDHGSMGPIYVNPYDYAWANANAVDRTPIPPADPGSVAHCFLYRSGFVDP